MASEDPDPSQLESGLPDDDAPWRQAFRSSKTVEARQERVDCNLDELKLGNQTGARAVCHEWPSFSRLIDAHI